MRNTIRWWTVAIALAGVFALVGCSQKKNETAAPPVGERNGPETGTATGTAGRATGASEHEPGGPSVTPAGTVAEIWVQIQVEESKLGAAIEKGQLKDVGHLAFGIRDLVVALADRARVETPAVAPRLDPMVDLVRASTTSLDELGDAGNLDGTQGEFAKLTSILAGMKAATTGH